MPSVPDTQVDWGNREFVNNMHTGMVKLVSFLNRFEAEARFKLAVVNEKLTGLERKAEFVEATMKHCRPAKRGAKSAPIKGTVYDPEWREKEMSRKTERIATTRHQILTKKIYSMKAQPGGFRRVISLQQSEEKDAGVDMYPKPKKAPGPGPAPGISKPPPNVGAPPPGPPKTQPVPGPPPGVPGPPPAPGMGGPPKAPTGPPKAPGGPPKAPPKTVFVANPGVPGPPPPNIGAPPPKPKAAMPPPAPPGGVPPPPAAVPDEGEGEGEGESDEDYSDDPDMPEFNPAVGDKTDVHVQPISPPKPNGKAVGQGSNLIIAYTGWIANNGSFFDQHEEFEVEMGSGDNIAGLEEILSSMKEGQRVLAYIPSNKGYGKEGAGDVIPPDSDLVFDLTLLTVQS